MNPQHRKFVLTNFPSSLENDKAFIEKVAKFTLILIKILIPLTAKPLLLE